MRTELVVASDIHLRMPDDTRAQLLDKLIDSLSPGDVRYLVLLGDIFDFCLGSSDYFRRKYALLGERLESASRRGIQVLFFEGNHEFEMDCLGWKGVEFVSEPYRVLRMRDGKRLALAHGDLVHSSWDYRIFRGLVKSEAASYLAKFVPGRLIELYAFNHARISRSADEYRQLNHGKLLDSAEAWVRNAACDYGVFGHFHVPYAESLTSKGKHSPVGLLSMESWDRPNVLTYDNGNFRRGYLGVDGQEDEWKDAVSLGEKMISGRRRRIG